MGHKWSFFPPATFRSTEVLSIKNGAKAQTSKTIEAEWNMKVWQWGKQIFDKYFTYTFQNDNNSYGFEINKQDYSADLLVVVTIKTWKVTNRHNARRNPY